MQRVVERLQSTIAAGVIGPPDAVATAHLLLDAINEAGMFIAAKRSKAKARDAIQTDPLSLLTGLRVHPTEFPLR